MYLRTSKAITLMAASLFASLSQPVLADTAVWGQGNGTESVKWQGSDSTINGDVHGNGHVVFVGKRNAVVGSTTWVTDFINWHETGINANTFTPAATQVAATSWPHSYTVADYMPGGTAAVAAGSAYYDLTNACANSDPNPADQHVSISWKNASIPDALLWAPCDLSLDIKNANGNVSVVSSGDIYYRFRTGSQVSAYADGFLALSTSPNAKAIHLNGSGATAHGFFVAQQGEIHIAGSNQRFECGLYADRVTITGSYLTFDGLNCGLSSNAAPLSVDDSASTPEDVSVDVDVLANDSDSDGTLDPATVTVVTAPQNGSTTVNTTTGAVTFNPAPNYFGIDQFEYTVADDGGAVSSPATVTVSVAAVNDVPVTVNDTLVTDEDTAINANVLTNDYDIDGVVDATTVIVTDAPVNGTTVVNATTGIVEYTPDANFSGSDSFTYTVQDDVGVTSQPAIAQVTVNAVNDAPVLQPDSVTTNEDTDVSIDVLANDTDIDHALDIAGFSLAVAPSNGAVVVDTQTNTLTYTPTADYSGSDSFEYLLTDAGGAISAASALVSITITPINDAPVATPATVSLTEDSSLPIVLTATDADGDTLSFSIVTPPLVGAVTGSAPSITYTPPVNYSGTETLTFIANDGQVDSAEAIVTINVTASNDQPTADPVSVTTDEDTPVAVTLSGSDPEASPLTYTVVTQPANGNLSGAAPSLTYTPDANTFGADSFTYRVNDGELDSPIATVSITVSAVNDVPMATSASYNAVATVPLAIQLQGQDDDGDTLTFAIASSPGNGAVTGTPPNVTYTANAGFAGSDQFTFVANDGTVDSSPATISLQVTVDNVAPVINSTPITQATQSATYSYQVAASDADGDPLSYFLSTAPSGMTITAAGLVEWQPTSAGTFNVVVDVSDGNGGLAQQPYAITVSDNAAPTFVQLPLLNAPLGETYASIGQAVDPDGDTVTIALTSGPSGSNLVDQGDGFFELTWPATGNVGDVNPFVIAATDSNGASSDLNLSITTTGSTVGNNHLGTDFWLGFGINFRDLTFGLNPMPLDDPGRTLHVVIGAPDGAVGLVEIPGMAFSEAIAIAPGETATVEVPTSAMANQFGDVSTQAPSDRGVHVTTDLPVTVSAINWAFTTTDAFLVLPTTALGTDYLVTGFQEKILPSTPIETIWLALATEDNTVITATPIGGVPQFASDQFRDPITVTLDQGEFWSGQTPYAHAVTITADKPIATFAGSSCSDVPIGVGTCDHLWQQFVPTTTLASRYLAAPIATREASLYRVIASEDQTRVFLNGEYVALLDAGDKFERTVSDAVEIVGSNPIVAVQYTLGGQFDQDIRQNSLADPFMLNLATVDAYLSDYTFVVPSGEGVFRDQPNNIVRLPIENHYLSVVIDSGDAGSLVLDGVPVDTSGFIQIASSNYLAGSVDVQPGTHRIAANSQFGATSYGFGPDESYGYYTGLAFPDGTATLSLTATGPATDLIAGSEDACIAIEVRDSGGALIPRARFQLDITGTVPNTYTGFTNAVGAAEYCYTQVQQGTDTITVSVTGDSEILSVNWLPNSNPGTNGTPAIISYPELTLYDPSFVYAIQTADPDGDTVAITVTDGPSGMAWSPASGDVTWTPVIPVDREPTMHSVELTVSDPAGASSTQQFQLTVIYPPQITQFPATSFVNRFGGSSDSSMNHIGGDNQLIQARFSAGDPDNTVSRLDIYSTWTVKTFPDSFDWLDGVRDQNLLCRAPGAVIGGFDVETVFADTVTRVEGSAIGPVEDTNNDGLIDSDDDVHAFMMTTDGNAHLFNLTTRAFEWSGAYSSRRSGIEPAIVNLDGDADMEFVTVAFRSGLPDFRLIALDTDGTELWVSSAAIPAGDYRFSRLMPIVVSDLDNNGTPEILYGPNVYDANGALLWTFGLDPDDVPEMALPVPADLDGDGDKEVMFRNQVRASDGTLLWSLDSATGTTNANAYHAVADISGNSDLEIVTSMVTSSGEQVIAWDASGNQLWATAHQGSAAIVSIADFDNDGELDIFQPQARTMLASDGSVKSQGDTLNGTDFREMLVLDLNADGVYERFGTLDRPEFRNTTSNFLWKELSLEVDIDRGDRSSTKFADTDHDGIPELLILSADGIGIFESQLGTWQLPDRDYRQHLSFDARGFGVDAFAPTNPIGLRADAWIGDLAVAGDLAGGYSFTAVVANRGTGNITEDITVRFYRGEPDTGTLLGEQTIVGGINAGSSVTASTLVARADLDGVMTAELSFANAIDECAVDNNSSGGIFSEIEIFDMPDEYRTDRFSYIYFLREAAEDPIFSTSPPTGTVTLGNNFSYVPAATVDNTGDVLLYTLEPFTTQVPVPLGVTINQQTGEINWTPQFADVGTNQFRLRATSIQGRDAEQVITVTVDARANALPVINTTPPSNTVLVDQSFDYDVDATDADGDTLTYSLTSAPSGMSIDAASGLIAWATSSADIGTHPITISVDDAFGGVVTQSFDLQVTSELNSAPDITSVPPPTGKATFEYRYQVMANDVDGDPITYSIEQGPAGMSVTSAGLVTWTPANSGLEDIVVRVSDGQAFTDQGWTLSVSDGSIPLEASIGVTPQVADLGSTVQVTIGYSGAAGAVNFALTIDGTPVTVDSNGVVTVPADTVGVHTATAIVSDPYSSDSDSTTYSVIDPNDPTPPPTVGLSAPGFEEEITAPTDVSGFVADDNLNRWFLALQEKGAPTSEFTILAEGTTPFTESVIAQIDPSMLMNGLYTVILQAEDASGGVSSDSRVIRVTGDLKVGNFSVTFEDFSAPVAGLPVTVLRTYDSRRRNESLDFGFGWSIDYQNVRVQESRDVGFSWTLIEEDQGFFSRYCVRPNGDPVVTVRMPDGELESFVARAVPECTDVTPTVDVTIEFVPIDGTDSVLEQTDFGLVRIINNNIADPGEPGVPIDPDNYRLTTPEGLVFDLDQDFGIRQVTEPNGSTLTYSDTGIVHSQGFALSFTRDGSGRITDITAPDGTSMTYGYDANGDLTSFTDQVQETTTYTYLAGVDHYLENIIDPRGITAARNEYDTNGRLTAHIDANGNRIEYTHDVDGRTESIRDRRGNTTVYVYDDEGNVLSETNALGETITRTYDADRNELSMTNHLGHTTSWTYDERANQLTETDALMNTTTSTYDPRNLLESVVDALGNPVMTNVYDANNTNLLTLTDALGNTTTFNWDSGIGTCSTGASRGSTDALLNTTVIQPQCVGPFAELPAWQEDARGTRTTFAYDSLGRTTSETTTRTDSAGTVQTLVTTMEYDDKGRLFRITDPENNVTVTEYNAIDKQSATIDANGNRTEYDYDDRGNLVVTRYSDLTTEITGYDEEGNVTSQTDRLGRTTRMTYDAANRLVETIHPDDTPGNDLDNPRSTNEYDMAGRLTASIDERGNRTEYGYDNAGRRTLVRDALLNETTFEYDARGLRTAMIDALNRRTAYVYDNAGRLLETIYPDGTPGDLSDNLRSITGYDALGRKTSETDLAGLITNFEYDELGNLTAVVDALSQRTEYGYDEQSNKTTQTDAENRITRWAYDDAGRVISRTLPDSQVETYTYDDNGNRTGHIDFNGAIHTFVYDDLNQQTSASYADGITVTTTYTDSGQVATVTDDRGTTTYAYDERDRLTSITYPNGKTITYAYDDAGNRTSLSTNNQLVTYTFDVLNRLATVIDEIGVMTYGYDDVGNRASVDYANGTSTSYQYDDLNRLTVLSQFDTADALSERHTYTLGDNGNRTQHAELSGRIVDYTYDDLYRLTEEGVTDATLGNRTSNWTYDAVGNRLTQTETSSAGTTTTTYVYDDNDRLTTETATGLNPGTTSYGYDNNGNTLSKVDGTGTTSYAYDSRNRLSNLNSGQVTYQYDASGIRQSETSGGLTTHYLTDPNRDYAQVVEESLDLNTFAEMTYTYGDDLLNQHRRVDATTTDSHSFHYDGIGSTRSLTDVSGSVSDTYVYEAFGEVENQTGITPNEYKFTGEQYDPNLGFYYLRARYYNVEIGRFQNMDTFAGRISEPMTLHKYLYGRAAPLDRIDPSGMADISLASFSAAMNVLSIQVAVRVTVLGFRFPKLAATAGFLMSAALPSEMLAGRPVIGSIFKEGVRASAVATNQLVQTAKIWKSQGNFVGAGDFENIVSQILKIPKNTQSFSVRVGGQGSFGGVVPDYVWGRKLIEMKTSGGAIKSLQAQRLGALAAQEGQEVVYMFYKKPSDKVLEKLARDVRFGAGTDVPLFINYLFP